MNTNWFIRVLFCLNILLFATACSTNKYVVYDKTMNRTKIDLSKNDQAVIMINNSYCSPCLSPLNDSLSATFKNCILVCLVEKSKSAMIMKTKELNNANLYFDKVYFQFQKKNDAYKPRFTNKLYRKYDSVKAPYALINVGDSIVKVF